MTAADVVRGDAFEVMPTLAPMPHVFTSLPDMAEIPGISLMGWAKMFARGVGMIVNNLHPDGVAIFYQTDRRYRGGIIDKGTSVVTAASMAGARIVWHKVAIHTFGTTLYRPAFSHLIAVSRNATAGRPTPDAWPAGTKAYADAIDSASLRVGLDYLAGQGARRIVDPFAGRGSIAVGALRRGIESMSVDIDPEQVAHAREAIAAVQADFR